MAESTFNTVTLDTILGPNRILKQDYCFNQPIPYSTVYPKFDLVYDSVTKLYNTSKYLIEFMYNMIMDR